RRGDSPGHGQHTVPLHDLLPHSVCDQARGHRLEDSRRRHGSRGDGMIRETAIPAHIEEALDRHARKTGGSRREFLRNSGLFVVSLGATSVLEPMLTAAGQTPSRGAGPYPDPDFLQLDSWIAIRPDNTATFSVGKTDLGQGTGTAFRQIMADELDI